MEVFNDNNRNHDRDGKKEKPTDDIRHNQPQPRKKEGKQTIMTPLKAITTLLFIVAVIYLFGLVWVSIAGATAPIGLQFWYPYIPGIGSASGTGLRLSLSLAGVL